LKHRVLMTSAAPVARVVMTVVAALVAATVLQRAVHVVLWVPMWHLRMAVTSLLKPQVPLRHRNLPFSAYAKLPRLLRPAQLTVKENNYVATRSSQIPQRAKRP
jgi:ABC-type dipeptide/oligopeptide/nickel transport system permease subunit